MPTATRSEAIHYDRVLQNSGHHLLDFVTSSSARQSNIGDGSVAQVQAADGRLQPAVRHRQCLDYFWSRHDSCNKISYLVLDSMDSAICINHTYGLIMRRTLSADSGRGNADGQLRVSSIQVRLDF